MNTRLRMATAVAEICGASVVLGVTLWSIWWFLDRALGLSVLVVIAILVPFVPAAVMGFRNRWHQHYLVRGTAGTARQRLWPLLVQAIAALLLALAAVYALWLGVYTTGAVLILLTALFIVLFAWYGVVSLRMARSREPDAVPRSPTTERALHRSILWIPLGVIAGVAVAFITAGNAHVAFPVLLYVPVLAIVLWVVRSVLWR